jgi:hypothetical protein
LKSGNISSSLIKNRIHDYKYETVLRSIISNAKSRNKFFDINTMTQTHQDIYHCVLQYIWRSVPSILAERPKIPEELLGSLFRQLFN